MGREIDAWSWQDRGDVAAFKLCGVLTVSFKLSNKDGSSDDGCQNTYAGVLRSIDVVMGQVVVLGARTR